MTIEIKKYSPELRAEWDAFIKDSKTPNFLFLRDYLDYHADRFVDASLLIYKNGKAVAAFPCNQASDMIVSHGGLTYGGLIVRMELHAPDVLEVMDGICAFFRNLGFGRIVYKAVPSMFSVYPSEEALYAVTRLGGTLVRRDLSSAIDLRRLPKLSDSRKNTARKAGKAGAVVQRSEDFAGFHRLLASVLEKFGTRPVHSSEELILLNSRFRDGILLFGTFLEGKMLAGALVYDFGDVVHTQYLAASDSGRKLGALDFLLMNLIEDKFAQRRYLSFGISTEQNGTVLNEGLIRQKEGFGGRGIVHDFYEIKL